MITTPLTVKALRIAQAAHAEQTDKGGQPYIGHPMAVAESMDDELTTVVALLHDVLEDSPMTEEDLAGFGIPDRAIRALRLLNHDPKVPYLSYVKQLRTDTVAVAVKRADLRHNMDLSRLGHEPTEEDLRRLKKYQMALEILDGGTGLNAWKDGQ